MGLGITLVTTQQVGSCQSLTDPSHWHLLLFSDLVGVSGIAKPPPYPLPAPYKNVFHFFFKQEKGAKASNGGRGVQSDIFIQIFDFLIYYI